MPHLFLLHVSALLLFFMLGSSGARAAVEEEDAAQPRTRIAIVIGNSDYQSARLEHLPNATNDATKLAESLERLNFDVMTGTNLSVEEFNALFDEAESKLPGASAVLIFYAGHGIQSEGENYLLPVDTPDPESLEKLKAGAIRLNELIARFANRARQTFIFLDACRNNPLGSGAGASDGLAQVEVGENTFIAFATQPGNVTVDGAGENSPFTAALLKNIEIPGLSISDMMIRVRNGTEALTLGRQVPWDQSNLREQFYFTEQQVLDPVQLSASLSRILSDPIAKEKLQVELASNDLQTAVLIVGQTLRSVEIPEDAPSGLAGTQIASLSHETLEGARQSVVSGIETLIVGRTATEDDSKKERIELARSVQTELRRLGCYRMGVDGIWGKGSVRAVTDFYRNTGQSVSSTEPTVELLGDLFLRSGRICKEPVIVRKAAPEKVASGAGETRNSRPGGRSTGGHSEPVRPPAPPPPDISGGIGIGGVF
ncbi:caspase family protein [Chelativorans salis]|uniref:Caspase family protein n=1 Tax=Chelativorans salis TaxID=2978478 RepID=A0ABT2LHW3_9HYPH|nr:caspase family protein [Chelativorans sp. EGI FJ00035]MCT7374156.1 caspase family protein [Chelativorans sp. EGI FJ00035]